MINKSKPLGGKKGQAAMEYLMTYGWALIAIVLVLGVLFFIFQNLKGQDSCQFQEAGLWCSDPLPQAYIIGDSKELHMNMRVWNKLGKTIVIDRVLCTSAPPQVADYNQGQSTNERIYSGEYVDLKDLQCFDKNNEPVKLGPNQQFRGSIIIWYNYNDDIDTSVKRVAVANVVSTVFEAS